jgi:hypothetical protein
MRCSFVGGILAGLMVGALGTGVAAAPEPSARLATIEEERGLVASAGPDDHARLRDHFARLANRSMANARGYRALAQSLMGNPKSSSGLAPAAHWSRLAELSERRATALRGLAAEHADAGR